MLHLPLSRFLVVNAWELSQTSLQHRVSGDLVGVEGAVVLIRDLGEIPDLCPQTLGCFLQEPVGIADTVLAGEILLIAHAVQDLVSVHRVPLGGGQEVDHDLVVLGANDGGIGLQVPSG